MTEAQLLERWGHTCIMQERAYTNGWRASERGVLIDDEAAYPKDARLKKCWAMGWDNSNCRKVREMEKEHEQRAVREAESGHNQRTKDKRKDMRAAHQSVEDHNRAEWPRRGANEKD